MIEGHLTSLLSRTVKAGLERVTFEVHPNGLRGAAERAARIGRDQTRIIQEAFCGWYTSHPRPNPEDILYVHTEPNPETERILVTLTIRRGHYLLADLIHGHEDVLIKKDGTIRCSCHPGETRFFVHESLPRYNCFNS